MRPSYLYNRNSCTGKTTSWNWNHQICTKHASWDTLSWYEKRGFFLPWTSWSFWPFWLRILGNLVCPHDSLSPISAGITKFAPSMHPWTLLAGIGNWGHWSWPSRPFGPLCLRILANLACPHNNVLLLLQLCWRYQSLPLRQWYMVFLLPRWHHITRRARWRGIGHQSKNCWAMSLGVLVLVVFLLNVCDWVGYNKAFRVVLVSQCSCMLPLECE